MRRRYGRGKGLVEVVIVLTAVLSLAFLQAINFWYGIAAQLLLLAWIISVWVRMGFGTPWDTLLDSDPAGPLPVLPPATAARIHSDVEGQIGTAPGASPLDSES
jgi:hypothetical protein